jgi:CHAD domain-containing protein
VNEAATIRAYYEDRINSLKSILRKPRRKFSKEDFHKLRVEIKKVKAVSDLVYSCKADFQKEDFLTCFQNIFRKAGKVRELALELSMLKKLHVSRSLKNYVFGLKKLLKRKRRRFFSLAHANPRKLRKCCDVILPFFNHVNKKDVNSFLEMKHREINRVIGIKSLKEENAHLLRKLLKDYYYTVMIFRLKKPLFKELDDFQELLGQWHDNVVMAGYLQKSLKKGKLSSKEAQNMEIVKHLVSSKGEQLFKKINLRISELQEAKNSLDIRLA